MNTEDRNNLFRLLDHEWLKVTTQVTALLISHYDPNVEVDDPPTSINFDKVQQLVNQLLAKKQD